MLSFVVVCHSCFSITMHAKLVLNTNTMLVIIKFYTHQSWKLSIRKEKKVIKLNWNFYFIFNKCDISIGMAQNIFNKFFLFLKVSLNCMSMEQDHTNYTTSREEQNVTVSIGMHSMVLIKWLGVVIVMPPNLFHLFYCLSEARLWLLNLGRVFGWCDIQFFS
jgi:hypothetical protein